MSEELKPWPDAHMDSYIESVRREMVSLQAPTGLVSELATLKAECERLKESLNAVGACLEAWREADSFCDEEECISDAESTIANALNQAKEAGK